MHPRGAGPGDLSLVPALVLRGAGAVGGVAVALFGVAQRLDWVNAWLLLALLAVILAVAAVDFSRRAPDLLRERLDRSPAGVPGWDRFLVALYALLFGVLLVTAGIEMRLQHPPLPAAFSAGGIAGMLVASAIVWWSAANNHYLGSFVRIQTDRGHTVATAGPYAIVRHPMYVAIMLMMASIALVLGSAWALLPALGIAIVMTIRTALEDRMLRRELSGYSAYAARVRWRLLPGLW